MTQENFDNPELKDVFDDLISKINSIFYLAMNLMLHQICLLKKFAHIRLLETIAKIDFSGKIPQNDDY